MDWWPTADIVDFPPVFDATETTTSQPFFNARINEIVDMTKFTKKFLDSNSYSTQMNERAEFRSVPMDGHNNVVNYSGQKSDIPCYSGARRGSCSITFLGDEKNYGHETRTLPRWRSVIS